MNINNKERIKGLEEKLQSICEEWGHLKVVVLISENKEIINKMDECENILIKKGLML